MKKMCFAAAVLALVFFAACEEDSAYEGPGRGAELLYPEKPQAGKSQYEIALQEYEDAKVSVRVSADGGLTDADGSPIYVGYKWVSPQTLKELQDAVANIQAEIAGLVSSGASLSSFDEYADKIREAVAGFLAKVQSGEQQVGAEDLLGIIKRAEVALGDLSTVAANIALPESDPSVTVTWSSSNPAVLSNAGVVARPSGTPAELTLTGTFTSTADPAVSDTRVWRVRVMHATAPMRDFLNVHYKVEDGVWKNVAWSGDYYVPTLEGNANITPATGNAASYGSYINLGSNGYIDLGPKVGALLRKSEWTVEFYINVASDAGTMLSFANDNSINTTTAGNWRGTLLFHNTGLFFRALSTGAVGYNQNSGTNSDANGSSSGNSGGIGSRTGQWLHLGLIMRPGGTVRIQRNWGRAQNEINTSYARLYSNAIFGSGSDELDDLRFGYLGRSVLVNSGVTGNAAGGTPNARIYEFKVYSRAVHTEEADDPNQAAFRAEKLAMNTAFGFGDTN